jgi:hypothetical protein
LTNQIYSDRFYARREELIRGQVGARLDILRRDLNQLDSPCIVRLMNLHLDKGMTLEEALALDAAERQRILASLLYNDAYWRLDAAFLMLSIGILNVTYSNLRSCLEAVVSAHLIENDDTEAQKFLKTGEVNQSKISSFVPPEYNEEIKKMKDILSEWGVHPRLQSMQLTTKFGPSAFQKMICKTTIKDNQNIPDDFVIAANACINLFGRVFIIFMWFLDKGTKYKAPTK